MAYEYSYIIANLTPINRFDFLRLFYAIDRELVYKIESQQYGIEQSPHLTLLPNLTFYKHKEIAMSLDNSDIAAMRKREQMSYYFEKLGKIIDIMESINLKNICASKIGFFRNEDFDVIYLGVDSKDVFDTHKFLKQNINNEPTFHVYHPHITLAYLKPFSAESVIDNIESYLADNKININEISFIHSSTQLTMPNETRITIYNK